MGPIADMLMMFVWFVGGVIVVAGVGWFAYSQWVKSGQEKGWAWLALPLVLPFVPHESAHAQTSSNNSVLGPILSTLTNAQGDIDTMKVAMLAILSVFAIVAIGFMVVRSLRN